MNALKHGMLCREYFLLPWEDELEYDEMGMELYSHFKPEGAMEEWLLEKIVNSIWRLRRAEKWEADIFMKRVADLLGYRPNPYRKLVYTFTQPDSSPSSEAAAAPDRQESDRLPVLPGPYDIAHAIEVDTQSGNAIEKVRRHESSLEKSLSQYLRELERLQAKRKALSWAKLSADGSVPKEPSGDEMEAA